MWAASPLGALRELVGGSPVVGDGGHRGGRHVAIGEQVPQSLREDTGLARTGRSDDARRTDRVRGCGELIIGEVGARRRLLGRG